jgi:Enoyl-(Acyl carrier protein) reductase
MYSTYASSIPMGRMCTPRDVANDMACIASDEADFITGVNLPVRSSIQVLFKYRLTSIHSTRWMVGDAYKPRETLTNQSYIGIRR